jgi:anti-sigma regulatory factor (Ser/Thr protein kinase)
MGARVSEGSIASFGDELHFVVPPYAAYLRAVRLVAADAAVRAGLDCEETEDFRLAVDELCQATFRATDHAVVLSFHTDDGNVVARGAARGREGLSIGMDDLSETIVASLSDHYEFEGDGVDLGFVVSRRRAGVRQ